ncbi:hypothetical protein J7L81_02095 [Candidatus Aerophobetes bacterium]|nr:hypothetical protein [Candidatus Aerophobetes bacterium]
MFFPFFTDESKYRQLLEFQKETTELIYQALTVGYLENENEVKLVERIVDSSSGRGKDDIHIFAKKIHGSASYVSFLNRDKPATTELGDMIIISIIVKEQVRLLQKISIVQNKKATERETRNGVTRTWSLDEDQLFLLKNFPKIKSNQGIFKNLFINEIVFPNTTNCLGTYGLLKSPGEMIFASASLIEEFRKNKKSVNEEDIFYPCETAHTCDNGGFPFSFPFIFHPKLFHPQYFEDFFMFWDKMFHRFHDLPFFPSLWNTKLFTRDLYDFVRAWTEFSIGEPTCILGKVINDNLDYFTNSLLYSISPRKMSSLIGKTHANREFEPQGNLGILALVYEIAK